MPDWKKKIGEHMKNLDLPVDTREEVLSELASHLEDSADADRGTNPSESDDLNRIQWHKLVRAIEQTKCKEGRMSHRTKTLWLPITAVLFATGLVLVILQRAAFLQALTWLACMGMLAGMVLQEANRLSWRARRLWLPAIINLILMSASLIIMDRFNLNEPGIATAGHAAKAFRLPWLLPLPVFGAVGALLARRAQASRAERLIAGLAPSLVWLATLVVLGLIFSLDQRDFSGITLYDLGISAVGLVILPGLALMMGVLPFLRDSDATVLRQD